MDHEFYMNQAIKVARGNPQAPFGSVLVDLEKDRQIVTGLNQSAQSPVLHGEVDAINRYAQQNLHRWSKLRLYTTAEPCPMCQSAIIWAGIPEVVFGTSIAKLMDLGWNQINLTASKVAEAARFHQCTIVGGVLADDCDRLFARARS